jgi:hypothetical protein
VFATLALFSGLSQPAPAAEFVVTPAEVHLQENFAQSQLLVTAAVAGQTGERAEDLTSRARFVSSHPHVVSVDANGRLTALANGEATLTVAVEGMEKTVPVKVSGIVDQPRVGFLEQVEPILSKAGCNSGACHASQYGKGGLKLSVFSFDPDGDRASIVRDLQGRRINPANPAASLLLLKPTSTIPHEGGRRLEAGSISHRMLEAWIADGAPGPRSDALKVKRITLHPPRRVGTIGLKQQFRVLAEYSDGRTRDVTTWTRFDSLEPSIVSVTTNGLAETVGRGQAGVMARFDGQAEIAPIIVPYAESVDLAGWSDQNFLDTHAAAKFRELGIPPSPLCDDATFARRVYLDAIGSLPTAEEAAAFLDSTDPDKRVKLVDRLLGLSGDPAQDIYNDRYTAWWTLRWADLLKISSQGLGERNMWAFHNWLRESFRVSKPMDRLVRELLTAKGNPLSVGPANYFLTSRNATEMGEQTAQLLLGVRLACAQCHHHPFEKYGQADYYGFAAYFQRVGTKYLQEQGVLSGENIIYVKMTGEMSAPRIGVVKPTPIEGEPADHPVDRRIALAEWLTAPGHDQLARNIVNRYVGYLLGKGLVHPVDDVRATNPASNPEMLEALTKDFRASGFDLKKLLRTIMTSRLYQLDSQPNEANATDSRFYSHFAVRRMPAEPLLDAIDYAAGSKTRFTNPALGSTMPAGTRAIELPDATYSDIFLNTFGKPKRATVCECERTPDENLSQALHTLNGEAVAAKIADPKGRIAGLIAAKAPHDSIMNELYLATLSRRPSAAELQASRDYLAEVGEATEAYQDLLWGLLNSKPFLFVR